MIEAANRNTAEDKTPERPWWPALLDEIEALRRATMRAEEEVLAFELESMDRRDHPPVHISLPD